MKRNGFNTHVQSTLQNSNSIRPLKTAVLIVVLVIAS